MMGILNTNNCLCYLGGWKLVMLVRTHFVSSFDYFIIFKAEINIVHKCIFKKTHSSHRLWHYVTHSLNIKHIKIFLHMKYFANVMTNENNLLTTLVI